MNPIVFYDGKCPLCRREIAHYQRLDKTHHIEWVDVHTSQHRLDSYKISLEQSLRVIHGVDSANQVIKGSAVFILIWSSIPRYRFVASMVVRSRLLKPLEWCYQRFAERRYKHYNQCLCSVKHCSKDTVKT